MSTQRTAARYSLPNEAPLDSVPTGYHHAQQYSHHDLLCLLVVVSVMKRALTMPLEAEAQQLAAAGTNCRAAPEAPLSVCASAIKHA